MSNPFAALFSNNGDEAPSVSTVDVSIDNETIEPQTAIENQPQDVTIDYSMSDAKLDLLVQKIFYITIKKDGNKRKGDFPNELVYLEDLANCVSPQTVINMNTLEQALFERLLLPDPTACVLSKNNKHDENVVEKKVITYLYMAERNLSSPWCLEECDENTANKIRELILRNAVTALKQPDLFENQNLSAQLFDVVKDNDCNRFIYEIVEKIVMEDGSEAIDQLKTVFNPVLKILRHHISKVRLFNLQSSIFQTIQIFIAEPHLAEVFLDYCQPQNLNSGVDYQKTLLGDILSISVLPKTPLSKFEYFSTPLDAISSDAEERNLQVSLEHLISNLHKMFLTLLKTSPKLKDETLKWISNCLFANSSRGKIWSTQNASNPAAMMTVSDGFMLNLGFVLVMLCQPFCSRSSSVSKCLKIDPTYCAVEESDREAKNVHMRNLAKETCIIPPREVYEDIEGPTRPTAVNYNFVTECFFMTHKALDLGYRVIAEKLTKISRELGHIRQSLTDVFPDPNSNVAMMLNRRVLQLMTRLLSMQCVMREFQSISLLANLHSASCHWLVQLALHKNENNEEKESYAPITCIELTFPLNNEEPDTLRCVPEFIVENIVVFLSSVKHFSPLTLGEKGNDLLEPILSLVLVFMGSAEKMRNPHLRARLAECLASMLPNHDNEAPTNSMSLFYRQKLFKEHPHRTQIVPTLLQVFVGIEVTGQSVQFEQKFNYRRPMYLIMEYLWEIEEHRNIFKKLSEEAEANMEAVTPPIFLRFINLLMNDAVYLLDEALNNMAQIRTMQARSEEEIARLPINEREEYHNNLRFTGMIARFDNILGKHTIRALEHLTREIKSVFCHPTMVDRIASMLNYFLLHLVGPNQKNFKVKDSKEYEFDPVDTVLNICRIYIHLGNNEDFCLAVSQDGRSYSPKLFKLAEDVLLKIGARELVNFLQDVAQRVVDLAQKQLKDEEILADAPEEFLDPIMSTIMHDPVVLPSSKITIDRTTIARHLLSDQSDPFNRAPLSMDQVKTNEELKNKIREWIEQKRKADEN